jgi:hypothetical protein
MPVKLNGATSGSVTIDAPAVAGTNTLTLPAVTDTLVGLAATQTLTNKIIQGGAITSATAQASTSGTSIDFTSIPSWVKRITVMFNGVSLSGTSSILIQLGDSGGFENTGYVSTSVLSRDGTTPTGLTSTAGFVVVTAIAANTLLGNVVLTSVSGNTWVLSSAYAMSGSTHAGTAGGNKTLSDTLDRVRITTVNGTDTFDAGSINILYE